MATITISNALMGDITDSITYRSNSANSGDSTGYVLSGNYYVTTNANTWLYTTTQSRANTSNDTNYGSLFMFFSSTNSGGYGNFVCANTTMTFYSSNSVPLVSYNMPDFITRTIDANGYCVLTNLPEKTPIANGNITYCQIDSLGYANVANTYNRQIVLTVGAANSGSDLEINDRTVTTTQPWRLDGTIQFRPPTSYTYST